MFLSMLNLIFAVLMLESYAAAALYSFHPKLKNATAADASRVVGLVYAGLTIGTAILGLAL